MRPIKLVMTGFESYCNRTEIDFEKLGKNGLYLITGETGAGKTTIFDAITYALYGLPSGDNRNEGMLRSHFASDEIPTQVELTFESNKKLYKVVRNPEYERKSKKGDGITKENSNATLYFITDKNVEPITKVKFVTQKIEEIIGIQKEQFCRIAMIAQGAFQKLLLANTNEKQIIFRELFKTEKFDLLQKELQSRTSTAKEDLIKLKNSLMQYLDGIDCDENNSFYEELIQMEKNEFIDTEAIQKLKKYIQLEENNFLSIKKEIGKNEKKLADVQEKLNKIEEKILLEKNLEENKNLLSEENTKFKLIEEKIKKLSIKEKEIPSLEKEKTLLEVSLKEYDEIEKKEKQLESQQNDILIYEKNYQKKVDSLEQKKIDLDKIKKELGDLKSVGENKILFESKKEEIEKELSEFDKIGENLILLNKEKENLKLLIDEYQNCEKDFAIANEEFLQKRKMFNDEQAGILAASLKKNQPCPVCGSLEHPSPAKKSLVAPTEKEVELAENNSLRLQKMATEKSKEAAAVKSKVDILSKDVFTELKSRLEIQSIDDENLIEKVNSKCVLLRKEVVDLSNKINFEKEKINRKEILEKNILLYDEQILKESNSLIEIKNSLLENKTLFLAESKNIQERKSTLAYSNLNDAKIKYEQISKEIEFVKNSVQQIEIEKNDCKEKIAVLNDRIKNFLSQISAFENYDVEELLSKKEFFVETKNELDRQRDLFNEHYGKNKDNVLAIENLYPKYKMAEENFYMVNSLYKVAAGNISGQEKISLETYVQMRYLDHITRRANLRLKIMTDGKYELCRRKNFENKKSSLGLELNVKDFYTGRERSVESLSGGEQFQASLALALGLSDEIQASEGGKKLDTMFIDEGFGTLDSDTLNKAMKALLGLSKGDKLIGIISHVEELENLISNKLKVFKDLDGKSKIEYLMG